MPDFDPIIIPIKFPNKLADLQNQFRRVDVAIDTTVMGSRKLAAGIKTLNVSNKPATELNKISKITQGAKAKVNRLGDELKKLKASRQPAKELDNIEKEAKQATKQVNNLGKGFGFLGNQAKTVGSTIAGVFAVGGIINFTTELSRANGQLLAMHRQSGESVETIQRLTNLVGVSGFDFDLTDLNEVFIRAGEARQELETLGTSTKPFINGLNLIGVSLEEFEARGVQVLIDGLADIQDQATKAFAADELFGGAGERLLPALNLPPEELRQIQDAGIYSKETALQIERASRAMTQLGGSIKVLAISAIEPLLGSLQSTLDIMNKISVGAKDIIGDIKEWTGNNPELTKTLIALGAAITALTLKSKLLALAQIAVLALSGPKGWIVLGAGLAAAAAAGVALHRGSQILERQAQESQEEMLGKHVQSGARMGTETGAASIAKEIKGQRVGDLERILPRFDCIERELDRLFMPSISHDLEVPRADYVPVADVPLSSDFIGPLPVETPSAIERYAGAIDKGLNSALGKIPIIGPITTPGNALDSLGIQSTFDSLGIGDYIKQAGTEYADTAKQLGRDIQSTFDSLGYTDTAKQLTSDIDNVLGKIPIIGPITTPNNALDTVFGPTPNEDLARNLTEQNYYSNSSATHSNTNTYNNNTYVTQNITGAPGETATEIGNESSRAIQDMLGR